MLLKRIQDTEKTIRTYVHTHFKKINLRNSMPDHNTLFEVLYQRQEVPSLRHQQHILRVGRQNAEQLLRIVHGA